MAPDGELDLAEAPRPRVVEARSETPGESADRSAEKGWLAIALAWTAGVVDAVGYILMSKVFTAHLSGDSAAFPVYAGIHDWTRFWREGSPSPSFSSASSPGG